MEYKQYNYKYRIAVGNYVWHNRRHGLGHLFISGQPLSHVHYRNGQSCACADYTKYCVRRSDHNFNGCDTRRNLGQYYYSSCYHRFFGSYGRRRHGRRRGYVHYYLPAYFDGLPGNCGRDGKPTAFAHNWSDGHLYGFMCHPQ
jgi:hypothetical protein